MVVEVVRPVCLALPVHQAWVEKAALLRVAAELATEAMDRILIQQLPVTRVFMEIGERTEIPDLSAGLSVTKSRGEN